MAITVHRRDASAPRRVALLVAFAAAGCSSSGGGVQVRDAGSPVAIGNAPTDGPASAPVVLVEFGDFECPYCGQEEPILRQIRSDYQGRIRFVFKELPLSSIHPFAELAAEAALAANAQGKFWPYHDALYAHQTALARADLDAYAAAVGLDLPTFDAALDQGTYKAAVAADVAQATSLGIDATPTLVVNETVIAGAAPYAQLKSILDQQLGQ